MKHFTAAMLLLAAIASPALADGDAAKGEKVFTKCKACHDIEKGLCWSNIGQTCRSSGCVNCRLQIFRRHAGQRQRRQGLGRSYARSLSARPQSLCTQDQNGLRLARGAWRCRRPDCFLKDQMKAWCRSISYSTPRDGQIGPGNVAWLDMSAELRMKSMVRLAMLDSLRN